MKHDRRFLRRPDWIESPSKPLVKDIFIRGIAWQCQAKAYSGLSWADQRNLAVVAEVAVVQSELASEHDIEADATCREARQQTAFWNRLEKFIHITCGKTGTTLHHPKDTNIWKLL